MRRVVCKEWGQPEGLSVEEVPTPEPGPGQALVEVAAAGVNFVDALFVQGTYQIKVPPPFTPGSEYAGTVVAVGDGVDAVSPGDRVLTSAGLGAWASHAVVDVERLTVVPDHLDLPRAAALVQSYCTMLFALTQRTRSTWARPSSSWARAAASGWPPSTSPARSGPRSSPRRRATRSWPTRRRSAPSTSSPTRTKT